MKTYQVYDQGSGKINEDAILIQDDLFGVFDGMSSLVTFEKNGQTGGLLAAQIAKDVFSKNDKSLEDLGKKANTTLRDAMQTENINLEQKEALWSTMAAVVRIQENTAEYFQVGDSLILTINKDGSHTLLVPHHDHDIETLKKWKVLADNGEINLREKLTPERMTVRSELNEKYGSINGQPSAIPFFKTGTLSLNNVKSIILFTDGLLIPKENPEQPVDWELFIQLYREKKLEGLLEYVREKEKPDPHCHTYPRFKQHDDIAAIGIDF